MTFTHKSVSEERSGGGKEGSHRTGVSSKRKHEKYGKIEGGREYKERLTHPHQSTELRKRLRVRLRRG